MPQYPGQEFAATLVTTSNAIAQEFAHGAGRAAGRQSDGKLWPGTFTEVHFHIPAKPNALSIPATALMFGERGVQVATVGDDQTVTLKPVQVGQDIGVNVEVLSGLSENDRLIDSPLETLNTGDKVRVVKENRQGDQPPKTAESTPVKTN